MFKEIRCRYSAVYEMNDAFNLRRICMLYLFFIIVNILQPNKRILTTGSTFNEYIAIENSARAFTNRTIQYTILLTLYTNVSI